MGTELKTEIKKWFRKSSPEVDEEYLRALSGITPIDFQNEWFNFPSRRTPQVDFTLSAFNPQERVDYDVKIVPLAKIFSDAEFDCRMKERDYIPERALAHLEAEMRVLRRHGIPVFIDKSEADLLFTLRGSFVGYNYSIPKSMIYKRFFVLNDFDKAVEESSEYARSKVHEFIDNYPV